MFITWFTISHHWTERYARSAVGAWIFKSIAAVTLTLAVMYLNGQRVAETHLDILQPLPWFVFFHLIIRIVDGVCWYAYMHTCTQSSQECWWRLSVRVHVAERRCPRNRSVSRVCNRVKTEAYNESNFHNDCLFFSMKKTLLILSWEERPNRCAWEFFLWRKKKTVIMKMRVQFIMIHNIHEDAP